MAAVENVADEAGTENKPTDLQQELNEKSEPSGVDKHDEKTGDKSKEHDKSGDKSTKDDKSKDDKPAGGYDSIPVPKRERGWTIRITVHRATNLPMADVGTLSSDPYVVTQLYTDTPNRHKEDPPMTMRTPTIRKSLEPEWNTPWTIANVPSSGFKLKLRVYDEDPTDHDDRLGNVHIRVGSLSEGWQGYKDNGFKIEKRAGSKRAYFVRAISTCFGRAKHMHGELFVSIELLGRTPEDGQDGRIYTIGPCWWTKHYSPLLGRLANTHEPDSGPTNSVPGMDDKKSNIKRFDFQANQVQLTGPVPKELYHRFVEFKPWVQTMFTGSGIKGFFLSKALHHQHSRVYHFDRQTKWGQLKENSGKDMTNLFLDLVHYDEGARIFTYVLTLDALWRFTETGKEFGIDMLSKHTMHSDVGIYIAFSGEFFIRRLKKPRQPEPPEPVEEASKAHPLPHEDNPEHPPKEVDGGPPDEDPPKDPNYYELVIDNDSGTYRPNAEMLPLLKKFLAKNLPGLHILTLDCQKDEKLMNKMKNEQRERKKQEGDGTVFLQGDDSSISSSDEDDLDAIQSGIAGGEGRHERGALKQAAKDLKLRDKAKASKVKRNYGHHERDGEAPEPQPAKEDA
ncbi:hypothetical protein AMS68_005784 [Peltaster fructicola]|uniref:C2 domain-containing protein n=1 Tax=Peltaster fructicola TaxID=286661 RepID=A0A6H0XZT4_9PEZI|nr:hypothetical protein AMS68_005784 [Peltaster fructicola]